MQKMKLYHSSMLSSLLYVFIFMEVQISFLAKKLVRIGASALQI
jgi:hypothetical protein